MSTSSTTTANGRQDLRLNLAMLQSVLEAFHRASLGQQRGIVVGWDAIGASHTASLRCSRDSSRRFSRGLSRGGRDNTRTSGSSLVPETSQICNRSDCACAVAVPLPCCRGSWCDALRPVGELKEQVNRLSVAPMRWESDLVGSADEVQVVAVEELADHVGSEGEGDAAVVLPPTLNVLIRVRPQEVTQQA
ncbi:hypothetical protein EYF80_052717 [Liparis tanakae]|uniref:Uncharacterized protein n=1 Tax=Liparis tanakae TaxID=230148 RepID=A0A4Z2F8I0_9TELE|nr:hypothetical protein EYF80_052717 [Liparis tanakae]